MTSRGDAEERAERGIPTLTELIMLVQAIANGVLVYWTFKEYLNNQYLQTYVGSFLAANMIALELTIIGVSGAFVGLLAKFKNVIWRIGKPDSQETMLTTVRPVRLKAETRESRGSDSTSKGSASSDALANAAARVFRQMEMGQAPTAKGPPSASHAHEGAEQRGSDERRLSEEQHRPVLRRSEPAAPLPATPVAGESSSVQLGEGQVSDQVKWPLVSKPSTVLSRPGSVQSVGETQSGQQHPLGFRRVELGRVPIERLMPGTGQISKQAEFGRGGEDKPTLELPQPAKHVESGQGPLDNPLPTNPLLPLLRPVERPEDREIDQRFSIARGREPGQASVPNRTVQNSQAALKGTIYPEMLNTQPSQASTGSPTRAEPEQDPVNSPLVGSGVRVQKRDESRRGEEEHPPD